MQNVKIQKDKPFTGSVEWLKNKIDNMRFRFSHREGVPSVEYATLIKNKETGEEKHGAWHTLAVLQGNPDTDHNLCDVCSDYEGAWISRPTKNYEFEWAMFEYLTPSAYKYCNQLIKKLADALQEKASSDPGSLSIKVIVE